jgi:hypothetical protein
MPGKWEAGMEGMHREQTPARSGRFIALTLLLGIGMMLAAISLFLLPLPRSEASFAWKQAMGLDIPGTIRILPALATTAVGGNVTVEVWLENVGNYYGIDLRLAFDPAVVRVPSGQVTPLWDVFDPVNHFTIKKQIIQQARFGMR